jgi:hypothetical protein
MTAVVNLGLGGTGAVDLLVSQPFPEVKRLITVGSQASYFGLVA